MHFPLFLFYGHRIKKAFEWGKSIEQEFSRSRNVFACEIHPWANPTPTSP
jgi:hypothetical protein